MKSIRHYLLPTLAAASLVPAAWAQKDQTTRRPDSESPRRSITLQREADRPEIEKEKVALVA